MFNFCVAYLCEDSLLGEAVTPSGFAYRCDFQFISLSKLWLISHNNLVQFLSISVSSAYYYVQRKGLTHIVSTAPVNKTFLTLLTIRFSLSSIIADPRWNAPVSLYMGKILLMSLFFKDIFTKMHTCTSSLLQLALGAPSCGKSWIRYCS